MDLRTLLEVIDGPTMCLLVWFIFKKVEKMELRIDKLYEHFSSKK